MPFLHRYVGNPILTFVGNLFFKTKVGDFHCGLRGFTKDAYHKMNLRTTGMEFASEIVVKASLLNLKIAEVPTTVFPSGRSRKPHLRTFPDGWRHLRFLLLYSPKWLFLIPGIVIIVLAFLSSTYILTRTDSHFLDWLPITSALLLIGFQFVIFYALTKIYATNHGLLPRTKRYNKLFNYFTLERGLVIGFLAFLLGLILMILGISQAQPLSESLKIIVPGTIVFTLGIQLMIFSFFFSILGLTENK